MRICHKCNAVNKDNNRFCSECQQYIALEAVLPDGDYVKNAIKREDKRIFWRKTIKFSLLILYYIIFNAWAAYTCYGLFGSLDRFYTLMLWYLPCLAIFFFPYDKFYCSIRKNQGKTERHLSDFVIMIFMVIGIIYMAIMYAKTYDIWAYYSLLDRGMI